MTHLPNLENADFVPGAVIDNAYFPLPAGQITTFGGSSEDPDTGEVTTESNDFFVSFVTTDIDGVTTFVIRDTAYEDGVLVEETLDFYVQDTRGNVWYFGEIVNNFRYDDDGNYVSTDNDGAWEAGVDGALPGWIMPARTSVGRAFYNEFAPGVALDEVEIVADGLTIQTGLDRYTDVLKTRDFTSLDPGVTEFKYYAPGVGMVRADEGLDENGVPSLIRELQGISQAGDSRLPDAADRPRARDFVSDGDPVFVSVISEDSRLNNALGYYTFDKATGVIGEARILLTDSDDARSGEALTLRVPTGQGIGFFMVPDGGDLGVDLAQFKDGGMHFRNMLTGEAATLRDGLAPMVVDDAGTVLPIQAFHVLGGRQGANFLNPATGYQAALWEGGRDGRGFDDALLIGFEDRRATESEFDADFDDLVIRVSSERPGDDHRPGTLAPELADIAPQTAFAAFDGADGGSFLV